MSPKFRIHVDQTYHTLNIFIKLSFSSWCEVRMGDGTYRDAQHACLKNKDYLFCFVQVWASRLQWRFNLTAATDWPMDSSPQ